MRRFFSRYLWIALLFAPVLAGLLRGDPGKDADPIPALIQQLGSNVFAKRSTAGKQLEALGERALPALRKAAAGHDDPEIRRRAQQLVVAVAPKVRKSKSIGLELVLIDAGDFRMGSPVNERNRRIDEDQHRIYLSEPFYLGAYEVTQEEYQKVMKSNPSWFAGAGGGKDKVAGVDTSRLPVEQVSWFDAIEFCNALSKLDGLESYYKVANVKREAGVIKGANITILGGDGYRLPTEAEWEYACRAWSITPFHFGVQNSGREANLLPGAGIPGGYGGTPNWATPGRTTRGGTYPSNGWGLYDMHGNVAEWCWDWHDKDYYTTSPPTDPKGPKSGTHRVLRSGSWMVNEASCRSASRFLHLPGEATYYAGFRVARYP